MTDDAPKHTRDGSPARQLSLDGLRMMIRGGGDPISDMASVPN